MLNKLSLIFFTILLTSSFAYADWDDFFGNSYGRGGRGGRKISFTGTSSRKARRAKARALQACKDYRPRLRNCYVVSVNSRRYGGWTATAVGTKNSRGGGYGRGRGRGNGRRGVTFYGTSSRKCHRAEARAMEKCRNYRPRLNCRSVDTQRSFSGCKATVVGNRR